METQNSTQMTPEYAHEATSFAVSPDTKHIPERDGRTASQAASIPLPLLLSWADVTWLLQVPEEHIRHLVNTGQLTALRIAGQQRFDRRDVERLVDTYKVTARRRPQ